MNPRPLFARGAAFALIFTAAGLGGCQQASGWTEWWSPASWFTPKPEAAPSASTPQSPLTRPITEAQKADVQLTMARSLEQQGRFDEAVPLYREAIRRDPQRADAYHRLAVIHDRKGEFEAAEAYFAQAQERDPKNAEIHCDLGYHHYLLRQWQQAETSLRHAIALDPSHRRAHTNLGLLYARTERLDAAIHAFRRAGCNDAQARSNVGLALMLENRLPEAYEQFQIALAAEPELEVAQAGAHAIQAASHEEAPTPPQAVEWATGTPNSRPSAARR